MAQRDENSLRSNSFLCSKHFEPSCFTLSDEVRLTLSPGAVPTIVPETGQEDQVTQRKTHVINNIAHVIKLIRFAVHKSSMAAYLNLASFLISRSRQRRTSCSLTAWKTPSPKALLLLLPPWSCRSISTASRTQSPQRRS